MNLLALAALIAAEKLASAAIARRPEPEVMTDRDQVRAYSQATEKDPIMAASYAYQAALATRVVHGCRNVVDLGCGPATQLAAIARLNPDIAFTGIDLSDTMLEIGAERVNRLGIANVALRKGDITKLEDLETGSVDGVISTVALHQLQTLAEMRSCLAEARRILKPDGAVFLVDFGRPRRLETMLTLAYRLGWDARGVAPDRLGDYKRFKDDYFNSLWAAFEPAELRAACGELLPPGVEFRTSRPVPLLCVMKTPDRALPAASVQRLRSERQALDRRLRRELDGIRRLCALGGIRDPFRG
jgi:ubiquinone/menaquinone biosynthesis C-methylase UbiE